MVPRLTPPPISPLVRYLQLFVSSSKLISFAYCNVSLSTLKSWTILVKVGRLRKYCCACLEVWVFTSSECSFRNLRQITHSSASALVSLSKSKARPEYVNWNLADKLRWVWMHLLAWLNDLNTHHKTYVENSVWTENLVILAWFLLIVGQISTISNDLKML